MGSRSPSGPGRQYRPPYGTSLRSSTTTWAAPSPPAGTCPPWAERGVLLLNTALTVEQGKPGSHAGWGWQGFVLEVCRACLGLPQPIVFLLWGGHARAFAAGLEISRAPNKCAIWSSHPSPLGARRGSGTVPAFLGSRSFSQPDWFLERMGAEPVGWALD